MEAAIRSSVQVGGPPPGQRASDTGPSTQQTQPPPPTISYQQRIPSGASPIHSFKIKAEQILLKFLIYFGNKINNSTFIYYFFIIINMETFQQCHVQIINNDINDDGQISSSSQSNTRTNHEETSKTENNSIEKKCENPDCSAPTLISLVPTRPTPQLVCEPTIIPNPILVNGYTTVFQVDGVSANINELIETPSINHRNSLDDNNSNQPIYRIVPNTHAHIVNYVIIDAEGDTLKKIKENDPATIRKLLDSQKHCAEQLEKLMGVKKNEITSPIPTSKSQVDSSTIVEVPIEIAKKKEFERMQEELKELRETVKLLSTAQKNESNQKVAVKKRKIV